MYPLCTCSRVWSLRLIIEPRIQKHHSYAIMGHIFILVDLLKMLDAMKWKCFSSLHVVFGSGEDLHLCPLMYFVGGAVGVWGILVAFKDHWMPNERIVWAAAPTLYEKELVELIGHLIRMHPRSPFDSFLGMSHWKGAMRKTHNLLEDQQISP